MKRLLPVCLIAALAACAPEERPPQSHGEHGTASAAEQIVKGPHRGRLLVDGPFTLELAIFETGVPPEFRAWATLDGKPLAPTEFELGVELKRLGDVIDRYTFQPQGVAPEGFLRSDASVYEPHSFVVGVEARHAGKSHRWSYESIEGRTTIGAEVAEAAGIESEVAGPGVIEQTITLYGRIAPDPERQRDVAARYPGVIRQVNAKLGDTVKAGDVLATIESNESLRAYALTAPLAGVVTRRAVNAGEQSGNGVLFTITDTSSVLAEVAVFPRDRARVVEGAPVRIRLPDSETSTNTVIQRFDVLAGTDQSVIARAALPNTTGSFVPGSFVSAEVVVAEEAVPLAVRTSGLQAFRDFTVVYALVGETYEVRMLELGAQNAEWAEVKDGLASGTRYVTKNSYLVKADIEKSAASHDH